MKKIICALAMSAALSTTASASWIDSNGNYVGTISSVGVNFFDGIGVGLTDGVTCNGSRPVVYLPYSNPRYKEILAVLVAAQASGQEVRMFRIRDTLSPLGNYSYCTITSASIGGFPLW